MVTHQGCLRRRAGAAAPLASRAWARGAAVAARGPAMCQYQGSPVSEAGRVAPVHALGLTRPSSPSAKPKATSIRNFAVLSRASLT